jgi:DNA-binding transcriptional MerR regulator
MEDVVRRSGLTPRAIRYYEELGLLTCAGRTTGGFRLFTEADVARLERIKELQSLLGFSLAEIKDILHFEVARAELKEAFAQRTDPDARLAVIDRAFSLIHSQIHMIEERVARLTRLREEYRERLARLRAVRQDLIGQCSAAPAGYASPDHGSSDERDGSPR